MIAIRVECPHCGRHCPMDISANDEEYEVSCGRCGQLFRVQTFISLDWEVTTIEPTSEQSLAMAKVTHANSVLERLAEKMAQGECSEKERAQWRKAIAELEEADEILLRKEAHAQK